MDKGKLKRIFVTTLAFVMVSVLVAAIACTPREAELLEGILQNVDAVNGEITIVTKDGKTMTLTIATETLVETEGTSSTLETLEPGASVEVEVSDDGQVARRINARLAKVEGVIVQIEGNEVTAESERGRRVTVLVTDRTRIELDDDFPGTLTDLRIGVEVEIKFDPESRVAFKIDTEEEEAEIEGVIVQIDGDEVTIETERGHTRTLVITNTTRIELDDDFPGIWADLQVGIEVEAKFDPFTRIAFKIEVEEVESLQPPPAPTVKRGIIEIRVTDPPPPEMDHIWVEIENLEVHKAGGSWITIAVNPGKFDLKAIEGIEEFLASQIADVGRYTQLRLDVKRVTVVVGEDEYDAKVPSGKIKLVGTFEVVENNTTVITLDFNGEKSVLVTGVGNYIFKPVIKLLVSEAPEALEIEITTTSLPNGQVEVAYTATLEATGGTEPYTWSISDGSLPDGLTLDSGTGVISGTPTTEEDYSFTVQVEDSSDPLLNDTEEFNINIEIGP